MVIEKCLSRTFSAILLLHLPFYPPICEPGNLMVIFNVRIEFLDPPKPIHRHQNYNSSPSIKEDIEDFILWRPSCPPFCVTDMSEINFNMLNRFLDPKNLCIATKNMFLTDLVKKILRTLSLWRPSWTPS